MIKNIVCRVLDITTDITTPVLIDPPENMKTLMTVKGNPILLDTVNNIITFTSGLAIDADGGGRTYAPENSGLIGLDYLANAGNPGNWFALVTENGTPITQKHNDPNPGYYISTTSYQNSNYATNDPRRYLDSEHVPYIVLPSTLFKLVSPKLLGSKVVGTNTSNGKTVIAVVGDVGPANALGEGSIAFANALGIPSNPKNGGTDEKIIKIQVYLNVPATGYTLQSI